MGAVGPGPRQRPGAAHDRAGVDLPVRCTCRIIIGAMVWVFMQRRGSWTLYRNWFLAMNFIAVIVFALLPTAPPRMIFTSGVADINFLHGVRTQILENGLLANPFAAMPSLHFGYALFIGIMLVHARAAAAGRASCGFAVRRWSCWSPSSRPATTSSSTPSPARSSSWPPGSFAVNVQPSDGAAVGRHGARARRLTWRTSRRATPTAPAAGSSTSASILARRGSPPT